MSPPQQPTVNPRTTPKLTVQAFYNASREALELELLSGERGLSRPIEEAVMHRPGLALTGFYDFFANRRIQVFGRAEATYLHSLEPEKRKFRWEEMLQHDVPCVILCGKPKEPIGADALELSNRFSVPLFTTKQKTLGLITRGSLLLHDLTAPRALMHGTLVDVGGVGVLLEGDPGIGKSETALGLVRHGNALISDDIALLTIDAHGDLRGTAPDHMRGFMEIRGLGFLHLPTLYGIAAVKLESRLDLIVSLRRCNNDDDVDRTGSDVKTCDILGLKVQRLTVPVAAGRDFVNVVETAAAAYKMRRSGIDAAAILDEQIVAHYQTLEQNHE
ncbi:MAG: HPr(Ser) kinase/phosphatase [Kiritimatiellia bacterium]